MPLLNPRTKIGLDTEDAYAHILYVKDNYHDPRYRLTQLWFLKEAVEEAIAAARDEILAPGPIPNPLFKENGTLVNIDIQRKAWRFAHNPEYKAAARRVAQIKSDMRRALKRGEEPGPTVARFKDMPYHVWVYLAGTKNPSKKMKFKEVEVDLEQ